MIKELGKNKVKNGSNMYKFVDKTRNYLAGECMHKCAYCISKDSDILMEDFTTKKIKDVMIGDKIIGLFKSKTQYYKFVVSDVINISKRIADTLIITTEDSKIEITPEHPIMGSSITRSCVDWRLAKSFSPYEQIRFVGIPKEETKELLIGWLSGFCDGDGCFFNHYSRPTKKGLKIKYRGFEAICEDDNLRKSFINICSKFGIQMRESTKISSIKSFNKGKSNKMVCNRQTAPVLKLEDLIKFSNDKNDDFYKGYIAGMIDTDGSINKCVRIFQSKSANPEKYNRIIYCLKKFNIKYKEERNGFFLFGNFNLRTRILFDFKLRHSKKKYNLLLDNFSVKGSNYSEVISSQRGNKIDVYNLETSCGNYIANGFIVHNCYVNSMKNKFPNIKERYSGEIRLLDKELKKNEGTGNLIFVQDMGDLFAEDVLSNFIMQILNHLKDYPGNTYLFQTKNPRRYLDFRDDFPENSILGTTIETNRQDILDRISKAPSIEKRKGWMERIKFCKTFVTLEPLCDFDIEEMVKIVKGINPEFVNIGADSKGHKLPEPSKEKVLQLIQKLKVFTEVKIKSNLSRLIS